MPDWAISYDRPASYFLISEFVPVLGRRSKTKFLLTFRVFTPACVPAEKQEQQDCLAHFFKSAMFNWISDISFY
jgi:hypothetical protein